ncbi:VOC family protein [Aquimarina litoralis]|uniref:VOC family protein n=1 Tax=Aquimarina litoralis TaxID=584605 RepID=A0ABN1ISP4_9FLAO
MSLDVKSIRTFIGAKDYKVSREFYLDWGFKEIKIPQNMSYFFMDDFGFYLQDYYVKSWLNNSMIFLEVKQLESSLNHIKKLDLQNKYKDVKITEITYNDWGNVFFLHDPSGVLWQIGEFNT